MFQVVVRVVNRLHNGIVDVCPLYRNPAHKIAVLFIHHSVLFKSGLFRLRRFRFLRLVGGRRFGLHKRGDLVKGFGALLFVCILPPEHNAGEKEKGGKKCRPDHQIFAFHIRLSSCQFDVFPPKTPSPGFVVIS